MTVTFASPLIRIVGKSSSKSIGKFTTNLFKTRGVQAGVGLGAISGGLFAFSASAKNTAETFGLPIELLAIIAIVVIIMLVKKR